MTKRTVEADHNLQCSVLTVYTAQLTVDSFQFSTETINSLLQAVSLTRC